MWINQVVQLVQLCQLAIHKHKQLSICGMWSNVSIQMEMTIWWSRKPKENYLRGKPLWGKPSPMKQIHYSKINFTILGFFFSLDSMAHRKLIEKTFHCTKMSRFFNHMDCQHRWCTRDHDQNLQSTPRTSQKISSQQQVCGRHCGFSFFN